MAAAPLDTFAEGLPRKERAPEIDRRTKPVWDRSVFDRLVSHVGAEKMEASLRMFSASLIQKSLVLQDRGIDVPRQRHEVHDLASASGFLGFHHLFQACLDLLAKNKSPARRREAVVSEIDIAFRELGPYLPPSRR